jgi:glutathione S-transferase
VILIGMFDSPFVRRVAVTLVLLGIPFEHRNWLVGKDFERIRRVGKRLTPWDAQVFSRCASTKAT